MSTNSSRIANVLLIDRDIKIEHDPRYSVRNSRSIVVRNSTRDLVLKFAQQRDLDDWLKYFDYVLSTSAAPFVRAHPHGSSYPVRDDVPVCGGIILFQRLVNKSKPNGQDHLQNFCSFDRLIS